MPISFPAERNCFIVQDQRLLFLKKEFVLFLFSNYQIIELKSIMRNNTNYEKLQYNIESSIYLSYIITFIRRQMNELFETMKMFPEKIRWWKYKWVNRLMIVYQIISCWLVNSHRKDKSLSMIKLLHVLIYEINVWYQIYISLMIF